MVRKTPGESGESVEDQQRGHDHVAGLYDQQRQVDIAAHEKGKQMRPANTTMVVESQMGTLSFCRLQANPAAAVQQARKQYIQTKGRPGAGRLRNRERVEKDGKDEGDDEKNAATAEAEDERRKRGQEERRR